MADRSVSEQLKTVLDEESKHVREVTEQAIKTVSKQAVQRLKTDSPKSRAIMLTAERSSESTVWRASFTTRLPRD